jgi:hypothetical protein
MNDEVASGLTTTIKIESESDVEVDGKGTNRVEATTRTPSDSDLRRGIGLGLALQDSDVKPVLTLEGVNEGFVPQLQGNTTSGAGIGLGVDTGDKVLLDPQEWGVDRV